MARVSKTSLIHSLLCSSTRFTYFIVTPLQMDNPDQTLKNIVGGFAGYWTFYPYCKMDEVPKDIYCVPPSKEDITNPMIPDYRSACWACEGPGSLQCTKCKVGRYCSQECQKSDWKLHRTYCNERAFSHPGFLMIPSNGLH